MAKLRYQSLAPLLSGEGSRAFLGLEIRDETTARPVVLIWLPDETVGDPEALDGVLTETHRAAQLEHPNIIRVDGLARQRSEVARVVEFADGETLRRVLGEAKRLPAPIAARIAADAATGLHYGHLAGNDDGSPLVHGDLRPETLLVSFAGVTKVSGYGALAVAPREPGGRRVPGRRHHCAPEQVLGGRNAINVRTDVYLLGLLLHECLTGEVPFEDTPDEASFDQAVLERPVPELASELCPPALADVVYTAMSKRASARYPSALAFRDAVMEAMGELPSHDELSAFLSEFFPEDHPTRTARQRALETGLSQLADKGVVATGRSSESPVLVPLARDDSATDSRPAPSRAGAVPSVPTVDAASPPTADIPASTPSDALTLASDTAGPDAAAPSWPRTSTTRRLGRSFTRGGLAAALFLAVLWFALPRLGDPGGERPNRGAVATGGEDAPGPSARSGADVSEGAALATLEPDLATSERGFLEVQGGPEAAPGDTPGDAEHRPATRSGVALFVEPPVDVTLAGQRLGRSPLRVPLPPGRHRLRLTDPQRGIDTTRTVRVTGATFAEQRIYLGQGYIKVEAPEGSEVTLDGRFLGEAPLSEIGAFEGRHHLVVDVNGARWQERFTIAANERLSFSVAFQ